MILAVSTASITLGAALWICFSFALGSFAQALSGFGFALISIPLAGLVVSSTDAVVIQTFAGCVLSMVMAWQYRADADHAVLRAVIPASFIGIGVGMVVANSVSDKAMRFGVGIAVIIAAIAIATGFRFHTTHTAAVNSAAGLMSGMLAATTGTNGPPLVIAMAAQDASPRAFRANLQVAFAAGNFVLIPLFAASGKITRRTLLLSAVALVPTVFGRVFGEKVFARLNPNRFRRVVLAMLFLSGTVALVKATLS